MYRKRTVKQIQAQRRNEIIKYIREHIPQPLEEILRRHRCYTAYVENAYSSITDYCTNVMKVKRMNTKEYQKFVRKVAKASNDIIRTFNWGKSKEGFSFWNSIYDEYIERLEQLR